MKRMDMIRFLPGKTDKNQNAWLPLWIHLTDTAGVIKNLVKYWCPENLKRAICKKFPLDKLDALCEFLALTHDIGKMTPVMARKLLQNDGGEIERRLEKSGIVVPDKSDFDIDFKCSPHALAGQAILLKYNCPETLSVVVGAHHGKPERIDGDSREQMELYQYNYYGADDINSETALMWKDFWSEWINFSLSQSGFTSMDNLPDPERPEQMLLTGLLIMADWIASNSSYFPLISVEDDGHNVCLEDRIQDGWEKIQLPEPWEAERFCIGDDEFFNTFGFYSNSIQKTVIEEIEQSAFPELVILEAPMGVGKTEAALSAAEIIATRKECGGLFWGLPTQATANGLFSRLKDWAKGQSEDAVHAIKLAHGMAELNEDYKALFHGDSNVEEDFPEDGLITHEWFKGRKQALLSEFVIGTIDQLLMAALKQKHVMLRHIGLAGKVVIIDEVHSYDAYMSRYLDRALSWLGEYKTPVIILSATLPTKRRGEMIKAYMGGKIDDCMLGREYPLLTWSDGDCVKSKRLPLDTLPVKVKIERGEDEEVSEYLREKLSCGGCAGVILNTVKRAQTFAAKLEENFPDNEVLLIHSGFIASDRAEKEKMILSRVGKSSSNKDRDGLIVVGTQVLEQSLDIDFDLLITDLCPMDLLLQRLGRMHRHDRKRPNKLSKPTCFVLGMGDEFESGSEKVYGKWLLWRTKNLLPDTVVLPDMISSLVQDTYEDASSDILDDENLRKIWEEYKNEQKRKEEKAGVFSLVKPGRHRRGGKTPTIKGLLDTDFVDSGKTDNVKDARAQAVVRDGDPSLEVLVMVMHEDKSVSYVPWQYGGIKVEVDRPPLEKESICIARQRLRLPGVLCYPNILDYTINELEEINRKYLSEWQQSPMLRGELILLLDENFDADICGYRLHYDQKRGLSYERVERGK